MTDTKHYNSEEVEQYIWGTLPEEIEIEIGMHITQCKDCKKLARQLYASRQIIEQWTAKTHGQLYWRSKIQSVLQSARQNAEKPALKERLTQWMETWHEKVGGMVEIILTGVEKTSQMITDLPQTILAPQAAWQFAEARVVRGTEGERGTIKIISTEKPEIQIITDTIHNKVIIQIEQTHKNPPLILLVSETEDPVILEVTDVPGTNYCRVYIEDLPDGQYELMFEPEIR